VLKIAKINRSKAIEVVISLTNVTGAVCEVSVGNLVVVVGLVGVHICTGVEANPRVASMITRFVITEARAIIPPATCGRYRGIDAES